MANDPDLEIDDGEMTSSDGVVTGRSHDRESFAEAFVDAIAEHRHWERSPKEVPA